MTAQPFPIQSGSAIALGQFPSRAAWLQESVQQFFGDFNWEDCPPQVQQAKLAAFQTSNAPLNLTLSVHQFFAAFNWDGAAIAAASTESEPAPKAVTELTVDDFFSQF